MNYTTQDAIALWQRVKADIREHGPDQAFANARAEDAGLLAMTLTLAVHSTSPLSQ